jgi:hypothetical protein
LFGQRTEQILMGFRMIFFSILIKFAHEIQAPRFLVQTQTSSKKGLDLLLCDPENFPLVLKIQFDVPQKALIVRPVLIERHLKVPFTLFEFISF